MFKPRRTQPAAPPTASSVATASAEAIAVATLAGSLGALKSVYDVCLYLLFRDVRLSSGEDG